MASNKGSRSHASAARKGFFWILVLVICVLAVWHFYGERITGKQRVISSPSASSSDPTIIMPRTAEQPITMAAAAQKTESTPAAPTQPVSEQPAMATATPATTTSAPAQLSATQPTASTPAATPSTNTTAAVAPSSANTATSTPTTGLSAAVPGAPEVADFDAGMAAFGAKNYLQARDLLSKAVQKGLDAQRDTQAREALNKAADQWLFSRYVLDGDTLCQNYKVSQGDLMVNIGKKFEIPYTFVMKLNGIENPSKLRVGQVVKVVKGPFHVLVERGKFRLTLYLGSAIARTYRVSLGSDGRSTPTGLWRVMVGKKQINPAWPDSETGKYYYPDDPENPLGERWVGLEGVEGAAVGRQGFGIHGTIKPDEIGKAASRGCIRLLNPDVEELYDMMTEGKTEVRVVE